MKERRSGIPEQGLETFLLKMSVVGESIGQSLPGADLHRYAVRQAVSFVGPRAELIETSVKRSLFPKGDASLKGNFHFGMFRFGVKWREERSPLVSIPPLWGGDFQGMRVYRSDVSFG